MNRLFFKVLTAALILMLTLSGLAEALPGDTVAGKVGARVRGTYDTYTISLDVPGVHGNAHNEIIMVLDASYSMDNNGWNNICAAVESIADDFLTPDGSTVLTLMSFGMSDNLVAHHIHTMDELDDLLSSNTRNQLLYGRSATNCEVGFQGVIDYLNNHDDYDYDEKLGELYRAYVIYVSDARTNMSNESVVWTNWMDNPSWTVVGIGVDGIAAEQVAMDTAEGIDNPSTKAVFGNGPIDLNAFNDKGVKMSRVLMERIWSDVYAFAGLNYDGAYPISAIEKAFVEYDAKHGTMNANCFYYAVFGYNPNFVDYDYDGIRAAERCEELADMDIVPGVNFVHFGRYCTWADPDSADANRVQHDEYNYFEATEIGSVADAIIEASQRILITPYREMEIVDYTSKWVGEIIPESARIYRTVNSASGSEDVLLYSFDENGGTWHVSEDQRPVDGVPLTIERVPAGEYSGGGEDVIGNSNGEIYKLTWRVKNGALLSTDRYRLVYDVRMDTGEKGFRYGKDYPLNGNTANYYLDPNNNLRRGGMPVPEGEVPTDMLPTGDSANVALWLMMVVGCAGILVLSRKKKESA